MTTTQTETAFPAGGAPAPPQALVDRVFALAQEVFQGDGDKVLAWLQTPHPVFGVAPVVIMHTREGLQAVEESLEGLSHGIF